MNDKIMTSRDVMQKLQICENTLLKYERNGNIQIDFRLGNRKRYFESNIKKSLIKLSKRS
jgi:predicted site-specific integrase-resolvase